MPDKADKDEWLLRADRFPDRPYHVVTDCGDLVLLGSRVVKRMRRERGSIVSFVEAGDALQFAVPEKDIDDWKLCVEIVARSLHVGVLFSATSVSLREN